MGEFLQRYEGPVLLNIPYLDVVVYPLIDQHYDHVCLHLVKIFSFQYWDHDLLLCENALFRVKTSHESNLLWSGCFVFFLLTFFLHCIHFPSQLAAELAEFTRLLLSACNRNCLVDVLVVTGFIANHLHLLRWFQAEILLVYDLRHEGVTCQY